MAAGPGDLYDLAQDLLAACVEALDTIPTYEPTLDGAPDRAFVVGGQPAADCCLIGDSLVSTERGAIPIRDVVVGDRVWAFDQGHMVLRNVIASGPSGVRPVFKVRTPRRTLIGTDDHPVLVLRPLRKRTSTGRGQKWEPQWTQIGDLERGDVLVALDHLTGGQPKALPDGQPITKEIAWLLGLWTGDGCFDQERTIHWFIHNGVRAQAVETIRETWGIKAHSNSERISVHSRELYEVFSGVLPRVRADEKRVPDFLWTATPDIVRGYLDGYGASDGHRTTEGFMQYATASQGLASDVRMLHMGLGDSVSNLRVRERSKSIVIKGVQVKNAKPLHSFSVYPNSPRNHTYILNYRNARAALPDERFTVQTVSSVEPYGEEMTYDITVEGAENFIADGLVVHNCPQLTVHTTSLGEFYSAPIQPKASFARINRVNFMATLFRCLPGPTASGDPPTVADQEAAAEQISADGWALWNHIWNMVRAGVLFSGCEPLVESMTALTPSGECGGWILAVSVSLDGYEETIGT